MNDKTKFKLGDTLYIKMIGYYHYGIYVGKGNVIHNSKVNQKVCCEPLNEFSGGRSIRVEPNITSDNREQAVQTAMLWQNKPYDLFSNNCEHFVKIVHGLEKHSEQIERALFAAMGAGLTGMKDPRFKTIGQTLMAGQAVSAICGADPKKTAAISALIALVAILNEDKK